MNKYITTLGTCKSPIAKAARNKGILKDGLFTDYWLNMFGPINLPSPYIPYLLQEWLRERYDIHIVITPMTYNGIMFIWTAVYPDKEKTGKYLVYQEPDENSIEEYKDYDKVLERAILFCIKMAPSNKEMRLGNRYRKRNQKKEK